MWRCKCDDLPEYKVTLLQASAAVWREKDNTSAVGGSKNMFTIIIALLIVHVIVPHTCRWIHRYEGAEWQTSVKMSWDKCLKQVNNRQHTTSDGGNLYCFALWKTQLKMSQSIQRKSVESSNVLDPFDFYCLCVFCRRKKAILVWNDTFGFN